MGKIYETITPELKGWLEAQKVFFVTTAPLSRDAHINCSPKGGNTFRVLNEREVAYQDLTGSGVETIAHVQENSRILLMFCAFDGDPTVVRLHGRGSVIYPSDTEYSQLIARFSAHGGTRAIIKIRLTRISDSCGFAVPRFQYLGERDLLDKWCEKKGTEGLMEYRSKKNRTSIDGIRGYQD